MAPTKLACGKLAKLTRPIQETSMQPTVETLQAEVLRLSTLDRAKLLDRLIVSLDADETAEAAWDAVADLREQELLSGTAVAVPVEEVIARLEARFPG
jgi:hypothetical protein